MHPGAWWLWALGLATAASRTTNPLLLGLILAVVAYVVACRRTDAPWARGFKTYVYMALFVIVLRVAFRMFLSAQYGSHVLFTLPEIALPEAAAGIRIGGPVSLEGILAAVYDGLRLATLLICVGAANVLANPKRLLKLVPGALHEFAVAVTVALTFAPQLVESAQRVRRARRLRGGTRPRRHVVREIGIPVLQDALDRSLLLAAGHGLARLRTDRRPSPAARGSSPARCCSPGSSASRRACTDCSTRARRARSACRCCCGGLARRGGRLRAVGPAGRTHGVPARPVGRSRSGSSPRAASPPQWSWSSRVTSIPRT